MASCQVCGKGRVIGNNVSHAHNKTKRKIFPNVQKMRVIIDGQPKRTNVCTRCLRSGLVQKAL